MSPRSLATLCLTSLLLTACNDEPPFSGHWQGELVSRGVSVEIGPVLIDDSLLNIGNGEMVHNRLKFEPDGNRYRIRKQDEPGFRGEIRLIGKQRARLVLNGMDGYLELKRQG